VPLLLLSFAVKKRSETFLGERNMLFNDGKENEQKVNINIY